MKILMKTKILSVLVMGLGLAAIAKPAFSQAIILKNPYGNGVYNGQSSSPNAGGVVTTNPYGSQGSSGSASNAGNSGSGSTGGLTVITENPYGNGANNSGDSDPLQVITENPYGNGSNNSESDGWKYFLPGGPDEGANDIWVYTTSDGTKIFVQVKEGGNPNNNPEDIVDVEGIVTPDQTSQTPQTPGDTNPGSGNNTAPGGPDTNPDNNQGNNGQNNDDQNNNNNQANNDQNNNQNNNDQNNNQNNQDNQGNNDDNNNNNNNDNNGDCPGGNCGGQQNGYIERGDPCPFCNNLNSHAYIEKGDPALNNQRGNPGDKNSFRIPGNPGDPVTSGQNQLNNLGGNVSFGGMPHNPGDPEPKGRIFGAGMGMNQ